MLTLCIVSITSIFSFAAEHRQLSSGGNQISAINSGDTVIFDLAQATYAGNTVRIPVSINTDDNINSLDFWFKFNYAKLTFDSLIDLTIYIQSTCNFSTIDSFLHYSSYALQNYANNTPLILLQFITTGQIHASDLDSVSVLLNGSQCSIKITEPVMNGISAAISPMNVIVFPNPATSTIRISAREEFAAEMLNIDGCDVIEAKQTSTNGKLEMNTSEIPDGIYLLRIYDLSSSTIQKIIVTH